MKCKLCHEDRPIRKSHIIPEMVYRPLYGPTHQIRSVDPNLPYLRFLRKGLRESLLCDSCEILLGRYESYFSKVWYGATGLPNEIPPAANMVRKSGLDYKAFTLFHFSILWRASVSTLPEFRDVNLGNDEEKVRIVLLREGSEHLTDYQLGANILLRPGSRKVHGGVVSVPAETGSDGVKMFSMIHSGCLWHYILGHSTSPDMDILQKDGTISMIVFDIRNIPVVAQGLARASTARRRKQQS